MARVLSSEYVFESITFHSCIFTLIRHVAACLHTSHVIFDWVLLLLTARHNIIGARSLTRLEFRKPVRRRFIVNVDTTNYVDFFRWKFTYIGENSNANLEKIVVNRYRINLLESYQTNTVECLRCRHSYDPSDFFISTLILRGTRTSVHFSLLLTYCERVFYRGFRGVFFFFFDETLRKRNKLTAIIARTAS